ncbi:MAG: hypothetical protein ABI912_04500 [Actinomycetota bacterium]
MSAPSDPGRSTRDDRILRSTRTLSVAIIPFLLVAFVDLYFWPHDTNRYFAWAIKPGLTPMILGSVYLGGSYFFARAARATEWHVIKGGFVPVAAFAALMGVATILHWDRFNHRHVAFWLWAGLYFTTPFLVAAVFVANRRYDAAVAPGDALLPLALARTIGAVGVLAAFTSAFLFLQPKRAINVWPWTLSPLTARVMAAIFALGVAAIGTLFERRWSSVRLMVQVATVMFGLIVIATIKSRGDIDSGAALTWVFAGGFLAVIVACVLLLRAGRQASA